VYDDPYLSFEDAYLYDQELKYKNKEVPVTNIEDDDTESNEGDLKIAETSADSGINESMDLSTEERTL